MSNTLEDSGPTEIYEWHRGATASLERSLGEYAMALDLNRSDFDGRVLDLGSGALQILNTEIRQYIDGCNIISVNPDTAQGDFRKGLIASAGFESKTVAAVAQQLPFGDELFDSVLGLGSVTIYAAPDYVPEWSVAAWVSEISRVLRPGGTAKLGPIYGAGSCAAFQDIYERTRLGESTCMTFEPVTWDDKPVMTNTADPKHLHRLILHKNTI